MRKIARAHTNIALIKYWGKQDPALRLPLMSSISMTLDNFYTDTYLEKSSENQFILNGQVMDNKLSKRVFDYLDLLKREFGISENLKVVSENHVPTGAGLASSSSAFAALAYAFSSYFDLALDKQELSRLARIGSGSATRSIYGGFVKWQKGDDQTSVAIPLDEHPTLPMHLLAIELNKAPKKLSSTKGMQLAEKSPFYKTWLDLNDQQIADMELAIKEQDFTKIGTLAEESAMQMHAINFASRPFFTYFEPDTLKVLAILQELKQSVELYVTIDAGPNVKVLCLAKDVEFISKYLKKHLESVELVDTSFGQGVQLL
ncbi:MAG: diphosphomevalonate decarboxylase [Lactobacillus sp.]|nr:diphosphomevalonate decarboxylase [Lactobacillus sp.]